MENKIYFGTSKEHFIRPRNIESTFWQSLTVDICFLSLNKYNYYTLIRYNDLVESDCLQMPQTVKENQEAIRKEKEENRKKIKKEKRKRHKQNKKEKEKAEITNCSVEVCIY